MASNQWDSFPVIAAAGAAAFVGVSLAYLAWSASRPASSVPVPILGGSRGVDAGSVPSDVVHQIIYELSPIDSVYFDVSVATHAVRQAQFSRGAPEKIKQEVERAKQWLGDRFALFELFKAVAARYITPDEEKQILDQVHQALTDLDFGRIDQAEEKLAKLQSWIAERFYRLVALKFKEKGVDPPANDDDPIVVLNPKFEQMTEKKVEEWKAKGYSQGMIDKALAWARDWATGIAKGLIKDQKLAESLAESLYPRALDMAENYMQAFSSQGG